jgi:hypothetical protein
MSGSYQQLLQKYNQLLALVLNLPAGGGTLQSVLTLGNTTTNSAIFQVGTNITTIEKDLVEVKNNTYESQIFADSIYTRTSSGSKGITLFAFGTPELTVKGTNDASQLFPNELRFTFGAVPPFSTVGMSVAGTGLNIKTNGTLTFQDLGGLSGQYLKQDALGNAVWDNIPTSPNIVSGTAIIPAGTTTGVISFGIVLLSAPTVVISQLEETPGGSIVGLAITSISISNFTWKSTTPNFGKILWIATI